MKSQIETVETIDIDQVTVRKLRTVPFVSGGAREFGQKGGEKGREWPVQ